MLLSRTFPPVMTMLVLAGLLLLASTGRAAIPALKVQSLELENTPPPPQLVARLKEVSGKLLRVYVAGSGLLGWVFETEDSLGLVYTTEDGAFMLTGELYNDVGVDVHDRQLSAFRYAGALDQLATMHSVRLGSGRHEIHVVLDPLCSYCHVLVSRLLQRQELSVVVIPVGVLSYESDTLAAMLLASADPTALLNRMMNPSTAQTMALAPPDGLAEFNRQVERNNGLIENMGLKGTPFLAARLPGGELWVNEGLPTDAEIDTVIGLILGDENPA